MLSRIYVFCILFLAQFFLSCSSDPLNGMAPSEFYSMDSKHKEMIFVKSTGKSVTLGTNNELVPANERPQMLVDFSYDFSLDEHEVTCGEFSSLMGWSHDCAKDNFPQANVTYYDAVLFANEKSKKEKLDTAYSYSRAIFDSLGNCVQIDNLVFDATRESYRLPTEAEWVYAASFGWNVGDGWTASNSNYETHEVCSAKRNGINLCDMSGNLMEWVNDWSAHFRDTTVMNFVGGTDGGTLGMRILKGGCFRSESSGVNLFSRGDVYTVTSSVKGDYIGFRLAFGAIPDAQWIDFNGSVTTSRLQTVLSGMELKKIFRTYKSKLAFRNDVSGNLAFVTYADYGSSVFEIKDSMDVFHPEISPDGKWVAFSTKPEGVSGKSNLFVRPLTLDSEALMLDVESAAEPRWIVYDGDTLIVYVDDASDNSDYAAWKNRGTWTVPFEGGRFGTPRKIMEGTFNGGVSNDLHMAVSGAKLLRVLKKRGNAFVDSVWYNEEQACNVSLAKDFSNRILFLDFGGKTGEDFVGEAYGTHERILISDSTGILIGSIKAPDGFTFDHTEWVDSNHVVATLTNINGSHTSIVMVDIRDSSIVELVKGDEVWHPSLWVDKVFVLDSNESMLDPDSAGAYYEEGYSEEASIIREKLEIFWDKKDSINTVILGSSRPSASVDPLAFSDDVYAVNLTIIPNIMYESLYEFENYVFPHAENLKYVVISLDIDLWYLSERESENNFFASQAPTLPGHRYDANHNFWKDGYPNGLSEYVLNSYKNERAHYEYTRHRGMQIVPSYIGWEENPLVDYDSNWLDIRADDYRNNLEDLREIIKLAAEKNVKVVGVIFPQSPSFRNTGSFGRYGIRRSQADSLIRELDDLSKTFSNFKMMDENKMGMHDYPDSLAFNRDHLTNAAGPMITHRIDSVLHSF